MYRTQIMVDEGTAAVSVAAAPWDNRDDQRALDAQDEKQSVTIQTVVLAYIRRNPRCKVIDVSRGTKVGEAKVRRAIYRLRTRDQIQRVNSDTRHARYAAAGSMLAGELNTPPSTPKQET